MFQQNKQELVISFMQNYGCNNDHNAFNDSRNNIDHTSNICSKDNTVKQVHKNESYELGRKVVLRKTDVLDPSFEFKLRKINASLGRVKRILIKYTDYSSQFIRGLAKEGTKTILTINAGGSNVVRYIYLNPYRYYYGVISNPYFISYQDTRLKDYKMNIVYADQITIFF